jgi:hypothetical protein
MKKQKIIVFQQKGSGESKIQGIKDFGQGLFDIESVSVDDVLPEFIDDTSQFLPKKISADLVLDFFKHPDLSYDLIALCRQEDIPVVSAGKKNSGNWGHKPVTCCAIPEDERLGTYGKLFGPPEFKVSIANDKIASIKVIKGSPCGATWEAAELTLGYSVEEAPINIGLQTQYYCTADPAGWDVIHGKSSVHYAAEKHKEALIKAIEEARETAG